MEGKMRTTRLCQYMLSNTVPRFVQLARKQDLTSIVAKKLMENGAREMPSRDLVNRTLRQPKADPNKEQGVDMTCANWGDGAMWKVEFHSDPDGLVSKGDRATKKLAEAFIARQQQAAGEKKSSQRSSLSCSTGKKLGD